MSDVTFPSLPTLHRLRDNFSIVLVVTVGLVASLPELEPQPLFLFGITVLGVLYLLLLTVGSTYAESLPSPALRLATFVLPLTLCGLIFYLYHLRGLFGMEWLILMPLVAQARILLSTWGTWVVCIACLGLAGVHLYALVGLKPVPGFLASILAAMLFVLLFTGVALREGEARAESERLRGELETANRKLAAYAVQAEELATERERGRLAREIHDSLGHYLTAITVQLEAAQLVLDRDPRKAREGLRVSQGLAREGLAEIRRSVASLCSSPLENRSLSQALADLAEDSRAAKSVATVEILGDPRTLSPQAELTLYRTAQEGLTNVRKHARASRSGLVLDYRQSGRVRLVVHDDGVGSDDPSGGFGLLGVRERVRQLAGNFEICGGVGGGLTLEIEVPE